VLSHKVNCTLSFNPARSDEPSRPSKGFFREASPARRRPSEASPARVQHQPQHPTQQNASSDQYLSQGSWVDISNSQREAPGHGATPTALGHRRLSRGLQPLRERRCSGWARCGRPKRLPPPPGTVGKRPKRTFGKRPKRLPPPPGLPLRLPPRPGTVGQRLKRTVGKRPKRLPLRLPPPPRLPLRLPPPSTSQAGAATPARLRLGGPARLRPLRRGGPARLRRSGLRPPPPPPQSRVSPPPPPAALRRPPR
jgi:hypothetical protein